MEIFQLKIFVIDMICLTLLLGNLMNDENHPLRLGIGKRNFKDIIIVHLILELYIMIRISLKDGAQM